MILVGGIGNIFFGDDGFGVEVVRRLRARPVPDGVRVIDFGIRGVDLGYALPDYDAAILVDTVARGGTPGTLYVIAPTVGAPGAIDMHGATPDRVLRWIDPAHAPQTLRIVGCEPASFEADDVGANGLSTPVRAAIDPAIQIIDELIAEVLHA